MSKDSECEWLALENLNWSCNVFFRSLSSDRPLFQAQPVQSTYFCSTIQGKVWDNLKHFEITHSKSLWRLFAGEIYPTYRFRANWREQATSYQAMSPTNIYLFKVMTETLEKVWNMCKVNNKNTRTTSWMSGVLSDFWYFFQQTC